MLTQDISYLVNMIDNKEIGRRLRRRREELGLTPKELADKLDKDSTVDISRWENGTRGIVLTDLPTIAKALYTTVGYFLDEDPDQARDANGIVYEPIQTAIDAASARGIETDELVQEAARFIRFRSEEEAKKRGG